MLETQHIFQKFGHEYRQSHSLSLEQDKAMNHIIQCRTSSLGGHIDVCDGCGSYRISYNSCRNRNCPKCLSTSGLSFVHSRKKFFIPVKVLSRLFRGKFLALLKEVYESKVMSFYGSSASLSSRTSFYSMIDSLYRKEWVVYCKKPFRNSYKVVEYLSRYTHKTAIYNNRLVSMDNNNIRFKWRDYRDDNKVKIMSLSPMEFIRRFLMHVLPSGFQKIRYYGLISNRNRTTRLVCCLKLFKLPIQKRIKLTVHTLLLKVKGLDISVCPHCGGHWVGYKSMLPATG